MHRGGAGFQQSLERPLQHFDPGLAVKLLRLARPHQQQTRCHLWQLVEKQTLPYFAAEVAPLRNAAEQFAAGLIYGLGLGAEFALGFLASLAAAFAAIDRHRDAVAGVLLVGVLLGAVLG